MSGDDLHTDRMRAESFGAEADAYERARPGYPAALFDDLVAGGQRTALDVGCGTGKSSLALVERGVEVLGVEPDDRMAEIARSAGLTVDTATIEDWDRRGRTFDLVISGQAWHWVDPVRGPATVREALRPGGLFVTFWNVPALDGEISLELDRLYERLAPEADPVSVVRGNNVIDDERRGQIVGFGEPDRREYVWAQTYSRDEWLSVLSTHSDHAALPDHRRDALLDAVGEVVDRRGGQITATYTTYAYFARRL